MKERPDHYPLTLSWTTGALLAGMFVSIVADDLLPGYAVFVLGAGIAMTWRRGEAPIFAFVIGYQWFSITIGYWYEIATGVFPSTYRPGDVHATVWWALSGLLLLAVGIRFATWVLDRIWQRRHLREREEHLQVRNLRGLFFLVLCSYAVDYVFVINPKAYPGFDVIVERLLDIRQVLLVVLWYEILRSRRGFTYLWITLAWVFVPRLGAYYSDFKSPLIILGIVLASNWRPWEQHWWRRGLLTAVRATPIVCVLLLLTLIWQAGVKKETRRAYDRAEVGESPLERIELFLTSAKDALPTLREETPEVVESVVERLSYITFFSLAIDYVPRREPFADGELLKTAIVNSGIPRFLFPDKPELPSDSYYTRRFTGVRVPEGTTSISIGYMAEFYSDWGFRGMLISVLLYGCWMGVGGSLVRRLATPSIFVNPVLIIIFLRVAEFETQFVKSLAALNVSLIVNLVVLAVVRGWVTRVMDLAPVEPAGVGATAPPRIDATAPAVRSL